MRQRGLPEQQTLKAPASMKHVFESGWARVAAAALCAALGGCASAPELTATLTSSGIDPLSMPADSDYGTVAVSITANTGEVRGIDRINVVQVTSDGSSAFGGTRFLTRMPEVDGRDTSVFIGALPPGEYAFSVLASTVSAKSLNLHGKMPWLGTFIVKPRDRVDLGRLIITPVNTNVMLGRSARVASNVDAIARFSPRHAKLFEGTVSPGWKAPRHATDIVEEYALESGR